LDFMNIPRNFGAITQAFKGEFDRGKVGAAGVDDGDVWHYFLTFYILY